MNPLIVGLGGSLRTPSSSLSALQVALDAAATAGADVELLDVRHLGLPLYQEPFADRLPGLERLVELAARADAMIWSSPLYHGTVSGAFKNALDWLQRLAGNDPPFLSGKPIGLIATAGGVQSLQAINTMEHAVRALRGWTVPFVVPIARSYEAFAGDGSPRDEAVATQLATLGHEVSVGRREVRGMSAFTGPELDYLLGERRLARVATVGKDGTPHVTPVGWSYNAELDTIDIGGRDFLRTKKFRDVRGTGRAAVVVDDVLPPWRPRGVEVRGRAEAVEDAAVIRIHPDRVVSWGLA